jgi:hypothetical protein
MIFVPRDSNIEIESIEEFAHSGDVDGILYVYDKYSDGDYENFYKWALWRAYIEKFNNLNKQYNRLCFNFKYKELEKIVLEMEIRIKEFEVFMDRIDTITHYDHDDFPTENKEQLNVVYETKKRNIITAREDYNVFIKTI